MYGLQTARGTGALERRPGGPLSLYGRLLATAVVVVVADQVTKQIALSSLSDGPVDVLGGVVTLRLAFNSGGAFGLLQGVPEAFLVASVAVVVMILVWARRIERPALAMSLGLVLGGGVGNLADRLFRDTDGRVVDFVDLHFWPIFNVADSAIVVGVGLVLLLSAREGRGEESG